MALQGFQPTYHPTPRFKVYGMNDKNGLMKSKEDVMHYSYCQRTTSVSSTFIVKTSESDKDSYHVDLNGEMMLCGNKIICMKCSCCFFRSTWIICGHICRAVQAVGPDSFGQPGDPHTVHSYFLVYNHPLNLFASICHFQASTQTCQIISITLYPPLHQTVTPQKKTISYQ
jgi:hypothetical protein